MLKSFPPQLFKVWLFCHLSQPWFRLALLEGREGTTWELSEKKPLSSAHSKFSTFNYIPNSCRYSVVLASVQREEAQEEKTQSVKDTNCFRKHLKMQLHRWRENSKTTEISFSDHSSPGCTVVLQLSGGLQLRKLNNGGQFTWKDYQLLPWAKVQEKILYNITWSVAGSTKNKYLTSRNWNHWVIDFNSLSLIANSEDVISRARLDFLCGSTEAWLHFKQRPIPSRVLIKTLTS